METFPNTINTGKLPPSPLRKRILICLLIDKH
jgi:hypothetical protein